MFFKRSTSRASSSDAPLGDGPDARLLHRYVQSGDLAYLGQLYDRYLHLIYGVCLKYLQDEAASQDAVMQIFEKLTVSLRQAEVQHFKSWLYTVAKNHCLMQLRSQKPHRNGHVSSDVLINIAASDGVSEDRELMEARWTLVEQGLESLPVEQQQCIQLFYLEQKSYQEITSATGYELKKVKSYIQNGKRNLKIFVNKHHE